MSLRTKKKSNYYSLLVFTIFFYGFIHGQDTYEDDFNGGAIYNNSSGNQAWTTSWVENNEGTNPNGGNIRINNNQLRFRNLDNRSISRTIDLSAYIGSSILLTLDYNRTNGNETIDVDLFNNAGVWQTVATTGGGAGSISYRLNANQIHAGAAIRFITGSGNWGNNETVFIDNVLFENVFSISDGVTDNTCNDIITDSGGTQRPYQNFENSEYTICPDTPGSLVSVTFNSFDVEDNFDSLAIYDGTDTSAPLLGSFDNGNNPTGTTISSTSGCLTFEFNSDFSVTGTGWDATISCSIASVSIIDIAVDEDVGTATISARLTGNPIPGGFSVNYNTVDNSALADSDYVASSGTLNFAGTVNEIQTFTVPIINNTFGENTENFLINLSGITNPLVATNNGTITINDDGDAAIGDDVPLTLFDEFNGLFDYSLTAGTFRTADENVDPCAITTSSSNTLTTPIPPGSTIRKAYLIWGHSHISADDVVNFEGQNVTADFVNTTGGFYYGMVSDVTSIVQSIPDPSTNTYDVTGLTIDNGLNGDAIGYCGGTVVFGGWSLFIFYTNPTFPAVGINMYNGFDGGTNSNTNYTLSGFYAIGSVGSKTSILSWEGDRLRTGNEVISVTTGTGTTDLTGDGNNNPPTLNNVFNATIFDDTATPVINDTSLFGFDLDTYNISPLIVQGETTVTTNVQTGGDFVILNSVLLKVPSNLISGFVFEDVNYPGGVGRNRATSSGVGIPGARVELWNNATGLLEDFDITDANGEYFIGGMANGDYQLRVVNNTVNSTRGGGSTCASCLPIQTYRTNFLASSLSPITNEIGGVNPSGQDVGAGIIAGAQTISNITINSEGAVDVDFGFNFNTIVNTNSSGQGSLAQFIINSNNLDEIGLDIETNSIFNPAAGNDTSIFMIPTNTDPLGRTVDGGYNVTDGYFDIILTNDLPPITGNNTKIDARTQTAYSGDSNGGTIGSGGTAVGTGATNLPNYELPEVQIQRSSAANSYVFDVQADDVTLRNMSLFANNNSGDGIKITSGNDIIVQANIIGTNALGLSAGNTRHSISVNGGTSTLTENYISESRVNGVFISNNTSTLISNNEIDNNGGDGCNSNINVAGGTSTTIDTNLIQNASGYGIDDNTGGITITQNTISTSGQDLTGCTNQAGILLNSNNSTVSNNIINNNGGAGIILSGGNTSGNLISQNSIFANGTIAPALGIDINDDGVTLNDNGDGDNGPNGSINFPVFETATISGTTLKVVGWSRPGATIEFFISDISAGTATTGDNQLGLSQDYGEGQTFLIAATEGSIADTDATVSNYTTVDGSIDNTNRFNFTLSIPSGVPVGSMITGTATLSNSTSEFGGVFTLSAATVITNRKITYRVRPN